MRFGFSMTGVALTLALLAAGPAAATGHGDEAEARGGDTDTDGSKDALPSAPPPAKPTEGITGPLGPLDPVGLAPLNIAGGSETVTSGTQFNPAISVIPDGVYYNDNRAGGAAELLAEADGFHFHGDGGGHSHGDVKRGFSLRETEVSFSGSVDPHFDVWAILSFGDGEVELEEGYVQTRKLSPGLQLKFGKFYSGIGYINKQHPHQWDFVDRALPYQLIFGGSLNETGIQATWLPNLPVYTLFGIEALQGENDALAQQIGGSADRPYFDDRAGPRLLTFFVKVAPDVGYSGALQGGLFCGTARRHQELHDENEDGVVDQAFQGRTTFYGTDWVYKYDSGKEFGRGDFALQGEYVYREKNLDLVAVDGEPTGGETVRFKQDAFYAQGTYGFAPRWTASLRYDRAGMTNRIEGGENPASLGDTWRTSAAIAFNPTEFSRLRVQYSRGDVASGGAGETFNQVYLQFQMSLGAHGAHRF